MEDMSLSEVLSLQPRDPHTRAHTLRRGVAVARRQGFVAKQQACHELPTREWQRRRRRQERKKRQGARRRQGEAWNVTIVGASAERANTGQRVIVIVFRRT